MLKDVISLLLMYKNEYNVQGEDPELIIMRSALLCGPRLGKEAMMFLPVIAEPEDRMPRRADRPLIYDVTPRWFDVVASGGGLFRPAGEPAGHPPKESVGLGLSVLWFYAVARGHSAIF